MHLLKQSTAFTVLVGPVFDTATGLPYTGMTIADFNITKNGTTAAMAAAASVTHSHAGCYLLTGTTGNSDTVGRLTISCNKTGYTMGIFRYEVLAAAVFDVLTGTTAPSTLTQAQISGGAYDLTNAAFVAALKATLGTIPASLATGAITAESVSDAAVTKIQDGLATKQDVLDNSQEHVYYG